MTAVVGVHRMDIKDIEGEIDHLTEIRNQFRDVAEDLSEEASELITHQFVPQEHIAGEELKEAVDDLNEAIEKIHRALRRLEIEREEKLGEFSWDDVFRKD